MPPTLKMGEPFKHAVTGKVHHIAWNEGDLYWVTTGDSRYGYLGPIEPWQEYAIDTKAKSGAPGTNVDGWKVGDRVMYSWSKALKVVAVIDKAVLLMPDGETRPIVEPNDSIAKFYRRKKPPVKLF